MIDKDDITNDPPEANRTYKGTEPVPTSWRFDLHCAETTHVIDYMRWSTLYL